MRRKKNMIKEKKLGKTKASVFVSLLVVGMITGIMILYQVNEPIVQQQILQERKMMLVTGD
jgi:hypothetical protein